MVKVENQKPDGDEIISRKIQYTVSSVAVPNIVPKEIASSISEQENTCSNWHEQIILIFQLSISESDTGLMDRASVYCGEINSGE
jgi:hypothetical protein